MLLKVNLSEDYINISFTCSDSAGNPVDPDSDPTVTFYKINDAHDDIEIDTTIGVSGVVTLAKQNSVTGFYGAVVDISGITSNIQYILLGVVVINTITLRQTSNLMIEGVDIDADTIADAVWEEAIADHTTSTTFGGKNQKLVPSESVDDYKADVSGLATSSDVTDIRNDIAAVPTAEENADQVWDEEQADHIAAGSTGKSLYDASLGGHSLEDIADAVWDEMLSGHTTEGSAGKALADAGAGGDPAAIADAVWDEMLADHVDAGSTGEALANASCSTITTSAITQDTLDTEGVALGKIQDSSTLDYISGAKLTAYLSTDTDFSDPKGEGLSDADGDYSFNVPKGATYVIRVSIQGYQSEDKNVEVAA